MHLSRLIALCLCAMKWPTAIISPVLLPFAVLELWRYEIFSRVFYGHPYLLLGSIAYLVSWLLIFKREFSGSFFSTFEHELTHAIFAWMTFNKVTGLTVTWREGGECRYEGHVNWLMIIAPYFFPTLLLIPILLGVVFDSSSAPLIDFLFGLLTLYHLTSTWRETHPAQSDLIQVRYLFAWLFLPAANVLVYGVFILLLLGGSGEAWQFFFNTCRDAIGWLLSLLIASGAN